MTLVAAFGFLMALSALRAPPLPQPSKFSRFKVLLTSYQASRSHQQAKQRLAASKGHIEGRRRPPEGGTAVGKARRRLVACFDTPPLYTTSDFNAILGGGRRWWYGLRGCRRVSGSRPPPRWRRARQWFRWRCLAWLACLSALKDFTSPCFSFSSSWFLFSFLVGNGGCYIRGCFLFAASRVHMAVGHPGSWQPTSPAMASPPPTMPRAPPPPWWRPRTATRTAAAAATAAASFAKSKRTCPSRWGGFCWVLLVLCNFLQHLQFDYVDFHSYTYM